MPRTVAHVPPTIIPRRRRRVRRVLGLATVAAIALTGHLPGTAGHADGQTDQAINPQPLPPRGGDDAHASRAAASRISVRSYIGETEKSARANTPVTLRPA